MEWPDHFPEGCPPEDAKNVSIGVYRLVHSPIKREDFESLRQKNPDKRYPDDEQECQACGLSVFVNIEDAKRVRRRIRRLRFRAIGVGTLTPEMGLFKPTPSRSSGNSHCTWWVPTGIEPWAIFRIVRET